MSIGKILIRGFFLFLLGVMCSSCEKETVIYPNKRVLKVGDNSTWANPTFDDSDWDQSGRTNEMGIFWVRFEIDFDQRIQQINNKGIQMISIGSYEAYWDGHLIFENGKVGSSQAEEIAGKFISHILLPDSLCQKGKHHLALRLSNHNNTITRGSWNTFLVEEYQHALSNNLKLTAFMFILGGAYLVAAVYYFFLFIMKRKDISKLLFSLICFFFFGLIFMEYLKFFYSYPYYFHFYRLLVIGLLTTTIAFVFPLFISVHFEIPRRKYLALGYGGILIFSMFYHNILNDDTMFFLSDLMLFVSIIYSLIALYLKRKGSGIILIALVVVSLVSIFSNYGFQPLLYNYDINLFVGFTIVVLTMLYLMALKNKEQQQAYEASLLLSARLKNELLKKNIRPHFIMNTLTSIMEWVEISPKKSIQFIEALAREFEILNDIADQQLIPIRQEIDLCKRHLEIMSYRKEVKYLWEEDGIDSEEMIPPAIIHTMVENGITHNMVNEDGKFIFRLVYEVTPNQKKYTLLVIAKNRKKQNKSTGGTGLKYIQSRLTENYGDDWDLISEETSEGWKTSVIIFQ